VYGDLFVQTVGDIDAMVDATFTSFDDEHNLDSFVFSPGSNPPYAGHPQVNEDGWMNLPFAFDPGVPVAEINGATLDLWAWDVDYDDGEVVTIGNDTVEYVLGGLDNSNQGYTIHFVDGVTTGSPDYGTLQPQLTSFTLTAEQATNLFLSDPSGAVMVDVETYHRAFAIDYATITIDYTPGAEPVHTPEPASMIMLGALGAGLAGARKLRRKK
jgi:hypothetical protein